MNRKNLKTWLQKTAQEEIPSTEVSLWPGVKQRLVKSELPVSHSAFLPRPARAAVFVMLFVLMGIAAVLLTPQGRSLAQEILQFFNRADSDTLPVQSWQLAPLPETSAPDPADISNANLAVDEVENQIGYDVLEPTWLPEVLSFVGANLDPEQNMSFLFYRYTDTNGLVLKQVPVEINNDCALCGTVGASALVETVQVGQASAEYVEGVWKMTGAGPVWESDLWLKTLRWQADGMAFELLYMGPPESVSRADLIAIAESLE